MAAPSVDEVMLWSVDDVLEWLKKTNLTEFGEFVSCEKVDGADLIKLDRKRISNMKNIPKSKKDMLLRRLKDFEKEKAKVQKSVKLIPKITKGRALPPINNATVGAPAVTRTAPPHPTNDGGEDDFEDDEEWEDDQGIYDEEQISQPPKGRRADPPPPPPPSPPPNDGFSDEDYVTPGEKIPSRFRPKPREDKDAAPSGRPPPPPPIDDDDDDNNYEKANIARMPGVVLPPRNLPAAQTQRPGPPAVPAQVQGPTTPTTRGVRPPVAATIPLYKESEPCSPSIPPPRKASPPPPMSQPKGPTGSSGPKVLDSGPKNSTPAAIRGRAPMPAPVPTPAAPQHNDDVWYEPTNPVQSPSIRAPPQEIYEVTEMDEELPPVPAPVIGGLPSARPLPPRPASKHDEFYEFEEQEPVALVPDYESVEAVKAKMNAAPASLPVRGRAQVPVPVPTNHSEATYEFTDSVDEEPPPPPPPAASNSKVSSRPPPPRVVALQDIYELTDDNHIETNQTVEDLPPPKPEKIQTGGKLRAVLPPVGIDLSPDAVQEAKSKLKTATPRDACEAKSPTEKTSLKPEEVKGVGGIRDMLGLQGRTQPPPSVTKTTRAPPPTAKTPVLPNTPSTPESHAPGAPEPSISCQDRVPPAGPPGGPPDAVPSRPIAAEPIPDPNDIKTQPFYFGNCGRDSANKLLMGSTEGGTYLVRDSKGSGQPYTLCIFFQKEIFNITIRKRPDGKFALGTEKPDEHIFETIYDMVRFHRNNAIEIAKNGVLAGRVKLAKVAEK